MPKQLSQFQEYSTCPMVAERDKPGNGHNDHSVRLCAVSAYGTDLVLV